MADVDTVAAWPRLISILVGAWLFVSAFAWPHTLAAETNTWIVGTLILIFSLATLLWPTVRLVNPVLAIWLFVSTLFLPDARVATMWSNAIVAIVVFALSLIRCGTVRTDKIDGARSREPRAGRRKRPNAARMAQPVDAST